MGQLAAKTGALGFASQGEVGTLTLLQECEFGYQLEGIKTAVKLGCLATLAGAQPPTLVTHARPLGHCTVTVL